MSDQKLAPIIVVKKKGGHGGHHGGAWKVAYADFVTAMMALFIVLWLMNTSQQVKDSIAGYFKDPAGTGQDVGSSQAGSGETLQLQQDNLELLKEKLQEIMKETPELAELKDQVQMTVTGEGLRIELLETEKGYFFESGSAKPSSHGEAFLSKLAEEVGKMKNKIVIEGHTDARPFSNDKTYSNWELSSDRANAARRIMQDHGLQEGQIKQVRGFAAQFLRVQKDPNDASNRRISVIIMFQSPPQPASKPAKKGGGGHGEAPAHGNEHEAAPAPPAHGETAKPSPAKSDAGHAAPAKH
ncbi:MAG: OmpA family protein [Acidobacteria bacterium]|nr:OmpA family protein [Acidobacteriota bacterium]